jgi:choline kinase
LKVNKGIAREGGVKSLNIPETKVVILAAGIGQRLGLPIPKSMVLVGNQSIVHRQVDAFRETGVDHFIVVLGFARDHLQRHLENEPGQFTFVVNEQFAESNTIYSLYLARKHITGPFFYANADVLLDRRVIERLQADHASAALAIRTGSCTEEDVKVAVQDGRVTRIGKTLEHSDGEFLGIARFDAESTKQLIRNVVDIVEGQGVLDDYFERAVDQLCATCNISAVDVTDLPCIEVDFPEDLDTARRILLSRLLA